MTKNNLSFSLDRRSLVALLCLLLAAGPIVFTTQATPNAKPARLSDDQRIAHVLSRLTYGARPGDFERVKAMGVGAFIAQQLDPDSLDVGPVTARLKRLPTLGMATPVIIEQYTPPKPAPSPSPVVAKTGDEKMPASSPTEVKKEPAATMSAQSTMTQPDMKESKKEEAGKMPALQSTGPAVKQADMKETKKEDAGKTPALPAAPKNPQMVITELQRAKLLRAVYGERQLYELMVDFWENHFSIFANKDDDRYLLTSYDRDTIRPFTMGRFRDLLGATAHSPAMLFYLDNWRSSVPRPYAATKTKPAGIDGGLNENYARELLELHTLGVDGGYTQKDVVEVARCFTGWTIQKPNEQGLFLYRPGLHDDGEKIVLGHKILPGGGMADGERVLDILAQHPATARFIATKLARRFISDDPPQSVIDRAAAVFLKTDGSIRETLRAILNSPEFFSPNAYRAKMRSPFEYVAAAMRALDADTDGDRPVLDAMARMGQPVFGRVTPDGYADRADQWLSSGAMIARFNFANALATNRLKGTKIDLARMLAGANAANKETVAAKLIHLTVSGELSNRTRTVLDKSLQAEPVAKPIAPATNPGGNVVVGFDPKTAKAPEAPLYITDLITLLIGSPEFQQR